MRKARIVCTLGPATSTPSQVAALVAAGMDVARLNFSRQPTRITSARMRLVRQASEQAERSVAVLQDLQGPKIRVGRLRGGRMMLKPGETVTITTKDVIGKAGLIPTTYAGLPGDVRKGEPVLLNDGRLRLTVLSVGRDEVKCRVEVGGELRDQKGINLPESDVSTSALTEKDIEDCLFGKEIGVDYVALSFVRSADDVHALRKVLGATHIPLIAKIEKPQAVDRISEIAAAADGIMVARGDLGVELPLQRVPMVQKAVIERTTHEGKIVIVATEMLESMVESLRPTRAEVSDTWRTPSSARAGAVMLSRRPPPASTPSKPSRRWPPSSPKPSTARGSAPPASARARSQRQLRHRGGSCLRRRGRAARGISTIVSCTETGRTARTAIGEHRPAARVIAFTPLLETYRRMALYWGVTPFVIPKYNSADEMLRAVSRVLIGRRLCRKGDAVVISSGVPNQPASTNLMSVQRL